MSKAIKWQIPFASLSGTLYRIDIYAEGYSGDPIQLTAGESPFVTDEDSSEDFFAPIRTQTGSIQVCTRKPDGTMLTLDEILPANNIDHPVRLINLSNSNAIEWQGFLSCEAYSQNYTAIPENLTLSVISVLEAMDSIFVSREDIEPLGTIGCLLARAIKGIEDNRYSDVYIPMRSWDIFHKKINSTIFFTNEQTENLDRVKYLLTGVSIKKIIKTICEYMGWTAREDGRSLYLQPLDDFGDLYDVSVQYLISEDDVDPEYFLDYEMVTNDIDNLEWKGTNHQRDIRQGAKSVCVTSDLKQFDIGTEIPELPFGDLSLEKFHRVSNYFVYMLASMDDQAYSNLVFGNYAAELQIGGSSVTIGQYVASTSDMVIMYSLPYAGTSSPAYLSYQDRNSAYINYAGAFLARMQFDWYEDGADNAHSNTEDGLFVSLFGGVWQEHTVYSNPVFQMKSVQVFAAYEKGYINLTAQVRAFWDDLTISDPDSQTKLMIDLRIGDKVWTGSQWLNYDQHIEHFWIEFDGDKFKGNWNDQMNIDEVEGLLIPVDETIFGDITLSIYPETKKRTESSDLWRRMVYGIFFSELKISYIPTKDMKRTDRGSNTYYKELNTNFRDDISTQVSLTSFLHNSPSPSLLFNANNTLMTTIEYVDASGQTVNRVPEVDLLNRLASYYGASRQTLDLITKHPTAAVLPLLKLNGINDGKTYLPLSESRDWRNEECTLKCFEMPTHRVNRKVTQKPKYIL